MFRRAMIGVALVTGGAFGQAADPLLMVAESENHIVAAQEGGRTVQRLQVLAF